MSKRCTEAVSFDSPWDHSSEICNSAGLAKKAALLSGFLALELGRHHTGPLLEQKFGTIVLMNKVSEALTIIRPMANTDKPKSNSKSMGKIRKDLVSFSFLSEAYLSLSELKKAIDSKQKISADLLVRYILEIETDFFYLFKVQKGKQNFCDAYIYYGDRHQAQVIKNGNPKPHDIKWLRSLGKDKVASRNHWSGLPRNQLIKAVQQDADERVSVLYKIFSGFTHPNVFTLERTLEDTSNIYTKYSEINAEYPGYIVASMYLFAAKNNLYGITKNNISKHKASLESFLDKPPLRNSLS
jgi:hypothetical protein